MDTQTILYLLSLGFTIEQIESGLEDWEILEAEYNAGLREWESN